MSGEQQISEGEVLEDVPDVVNVAPGEDTKEEDAKEGVNAGDSCLPACASSSNAKDYTSLQPKVKAAVLAVQAASDLKNSKGSKVLFNATHCMYDCIFAAAESRGWRLIKAKGTEENRVVPKNAYTCNVHWLDESGLSEWFPKIEPWMRVNHFPGTHNALARKSRLARNMARLQRIFPVEYSFLPDTWVLPDEINELEKSFDKSGNGKAIYIAKPDGGTQGRGIFLTNNLDRLKKCADRDNLFVVQRYISKPMLIEDLKFDLRLYFLISSVVTEKGALLPRYFLFRDGLVRLCTTEYVAPSADNIDQKRMHLTNYAINKKSKDFQQNDGDDDGAGSKRSLKWFMEYIGECHGDEERKKLWNKLRGVCVKTCLAVHPTMEAEYTNVLPKDYSGGIMGCRCFEVLGVDIMLDAKRRPYLIEINHLPSFTCDSPLDEDIKSRVVEQTLDLTCQCDANDKHTYEAAVAAKKQGSLESPGPTVSPIGSSALEVESYKDFERVYPAPPDTPKAAARYEAILARVTEVFRPVVAAGKRAERPSSSERGGRPSSSERGGVASDSTKEDKSAKPGYGCQKAAEPSSSSSGGLPPRPPPAPLKIKPPALGASGDSAMGAAARRARSMPVSQRGMSDSALRRPASREGSAQPRQRQPRQSLPMAAVQIGFKPLPST